MLEIALLGVGVLGLARTIQLLRRDAAQRRIIRRRLDEIRSARHAR